MAGHHGRGRSREGHGLGPQSPYNKIMHRFLLHNGEIREAHERLLLPGQMGLLSGWGVFSTVRVYDGVLFAWERHWARMEHDARRLRVPFPSDSPRILQ